MQTRVLTESDAEAYRLLRLSGRLVGLVGCRRPEPAGKRRHIAMIWGMYVVPEARGRGVGRRLLLTALERARQWPDLDHVWLGRDNHPDGRPCPLRLLRLRVLRAPPARSENRRPFLRRGTDGASPAMT